MPVQKKSGNLLNAPRILVDNFYNTVELVNIIGLKSFLPCYTYSLVHNYKTTSYFNNAIINFANFSVCTITYLKISDHNYRKTG